MDRNQKSMLGIGIVAVLIIYLGVLSFSNALSFYVLILGILICLSTGVRQRIASILLILTALAFPVLAVTEEDITSNLNCPEGGGCTMLVIDCPMDSANEMKETVRGMIAEGMSEKKIYRELEAKYGREIFATPPKEGFDWIVWIALPAGIIVGGVAVYRISRKRMDENEEFEYEYEKFLQEREKHE